jgi:hypothetical protein
VTPFSKNAVLSKYPPAPPPAPVKLFNVHPPPAPPPATTKYEIATAGDNEPEDENVWIMFPPDVVTVPPANTCGDG